MDEDILKILGGEKETPEPPKEPAKEPEKEPEKVEVKPEQTKEEVEKANTKANLDKAIAEAKEELRKIREAKKKEKSNLEDEDIPKINFDDPSAKAWERHIKQEVTPLQAELDKEKSEIRQFALQEFLADKPALAKNPEKVKELVGVYERIHTASERTKEGVLLDLNKSYAAVFHDELLEVARNRRADIAKSDTLLSDIAVSRGATAYSVPNEPSPQYSDEDLKWLSRWGMTPQEHAGLIKEQKKKV